MKLNQRYSKLTQEQRDALAEKAGISSGYLWQLATGWRRPGRNHVKVRPSLDLLRRLCEADRKLSIPDLLNEFAEGAQTVHPEAAVETNGA